MMDTSTRAAVSDDSVDDEVSMLEILAVLAQNRWIILFLPLLFAGLAVGASYLFKPRYTAVTTLLVSDNRGSASSALLASLSSLAGLPGGLSKSQSEQYATLMTSVTVLDKLIEKFNLIDIYGSTYRFEARKELLTRSKIIIGKKDDSIKLSVDDEDPDRSAAIANAFVEEFLVLSRRLTNSEAHRRRIFFEQEMNAAHAKLNAAQDALKLSGFDPGSIKAEPSATAEGYASLKADLISAEVKLQGLRSMFTEEAPEVKRQLSILSALRRQLESSEMPRAQKSESDYVGRLREFKFEETLYELLSRQYELARVDESHEADPVQVVDRATRPEYKSWPKRLLWATIAWLVTLLATIFAIFCRSAWRRACVDPNASVFVAQIRNAFRHSG